VGVSCAIASPDAEALPSLSPSEVANSSHSSPTAEVTSLHTQLPSSTSTLTPTGLLSIGDPTTTPTETLAAAIIATHPYSKELLFAPFGHPLEYQFVETVVGPDLDWRSDYITNTNETFRALTACNSELCQDRIFIERLDTGQTFEFLFSARLNWRPITHMRWLDNDILVFDQWSQPHYGFAFAIDVREQELLLVVHVTDECFVYGICE
jgi:hypothetical protein